MTLADGSAARNMMRESREFEEIVVYGSRGFSQMILRGMDELWQGRVRLLAMVDDLENGHLHPDLGVPVLDAAERRARFPDVPVFVTPGSSALRAKLIARLAEEGATLATVIFPVWAMSIRARFTGRDAIARITRGSARMSASGRGRRFLAPFWPMT